MPSHEVGDPLLPRRYLVEVEDQIQFADLKQGE